MKGDPGYRTPEELQKFTVYFNGKQETLCEVADEEQGYISRVMTTRDPFSRKLVQRRSPKIYGKVEIKEIA
jgi:hypothetical protein